MRLSRTGLAPRGQAVSTPCSRQFRIVERVPLSDDWLSWDPERLHTYPGANAEPELGIEARFLEEDCHGAIEAVPEEWQAVSRVEFGYFVGLGFAVGLAVSTAAIALVYLVT